MWVPICLGLLTLIVILVVIVATRPSDFQISRTITISASPAEVFPKVNNLHEWQEWSPWAQKDPGAKPVYEGPKEGVGAVCRWSGGKAIGEGSMSITESLPDELVALRLEFIKPFAVTSTAQFTFRKEGKQTVVTWTMYGENTFMMKTIALFMNLDTVIGGEFEKGLASLKSLVEANA